MVIIWTPQLEGILKYSHTDSLQCLSHNPVTHQLLSCASGDFGTFAEVFPIENRFALDSSLNLCMDFTFVLLFEWHP